jgi:hypothetical protein
MSTIPLPWRDSSLLVAFPWSGLHPMAQAALIALVCLVPLGLILCLYRYELRLVAGATALALLLLRLAAFTVVLGLVCLQPVYSRDRGIELPGRVLLAIDCSDSMDVADPQREPVEKLRLARALKLAADLCPDDRLAGWIKDYEEKKEPSWAGANEARGDPARRADLEAQRRKLHDRVCTRVDAFTRMALAGRVVEDEGVKLLSRLVARHKVEVVGFHRDTWDLAPDRLEEVFGRLPATGKEAPRAITGESGLAGRSFTDLRQPLLRAVERAGPVKGDLLGIVLLTDGQHNTGDPPTAEAIKLGQRKVPIYPVVLGARKSPPDAAVVMVRGPNHTVFKDVDATIDVRFKITGLAAQDFTLQLHREGAERKLLATKTISHDGKDRDYTESIPVRMDQAGTQTITATIKPVRADVKETRLDNNSRATTVSVADDKAKVLLVDGEARWEWHYLHTALKRDRAIELKSVVFDQPRLDDSLTQGALEQMGSPGQRWPGGPDALAGYQCIILGDVEAERLPLAERERLEKYVADAGGTLIVLAGKRWMPLAFPEVGPGGEPDPLRRLLPIESPHELAPEDGFALTLALGARDLKFMELDPDRDENEALWAGRPRPWAWAVAGKAKPGATVLAYVADPADLNRPVSQRERKTAVIARHNYGFGRVLYVGIDNTWRWRWKVGDLYHHRFWGQAIRWAASDKPLVVGNQFLRFGTPQPVYRPGEDVEVVVRFNDALGEVKPDLLAGARIIRLPDNPQEKEQAVALVPLARRPAQPRVLEGKVRDLPPGRFAVELAIPDLSDKLLAPAEPGQQARPLRAVFTSLAAENREMIDLGTNWTLLEELAARSGGQVFAAEDSGQLADLLARRSVPDVEHHEQPLYRWWRLLALVVVLLSLEWVIRKWAGLP